MKQLLFYIIIILALLVGKPASASLRSYDNPYEWNVAKQLIHNYNRGNSEYRLKVDLKRIKPGRIYCYVYSVIPERLNIKTNSSRKEIWIEPVKNQKDKASLRMAKKINQKIIKKDMTALDKIVAIHDWIVMNTTFAAKEANAEKMTKDNIWAFCADGVFLRHSAVCSGYAAAFKVLCREAGIPCFSVNSKTKNHTWNAVYYRGAFRFIDASSESRHTRKIDIGSIYRYFMCNKNELAISKFAFDESGDNSLNASEYIGFFNYYTGKSHDASAASVHTGLMEYLAGKQDEYAMFELGACYQNGLFGCPKDDKKCFEWQYQSALLGHTVSQNNIGYFYKKGLGVMKDYEKAFYWYSKAAEKGYIYSQIQLGSFYREGLYVEKDMEKSEYWYREAAKQGSEDAKACLKKYFPLQRYDFISYDAKKTPPPEYSP